jgi:hypothetical protein
MTDRPLDEMSSTLEQEIFAWCTDNPGASLDSLSERFNVSIADVYPIKLRAAGVERELAEVEPFEDELDAVLDSRACDYGRFIDNALLAQNLKGALRDHAEEQGTVLAPDQWEALEMIMSKVSRLLTGDPHKVDSWVDIAGYATLVADRLKGRLR